MVNTAVPNQGLQALLQGVVTVVVVVTVISIVAVVIVLHPLASELVVVVVLIHLLIYSHLCPVISITVTLQKYFSFFRLEFFYRSHD
jgi:hypothetical protein